MRIRSPSSRATSRCRFSAYDVCLVAVSPLLALYIRDAYILSEQGAGLAAIYCVVSFIASLVALAAFGAHRGIPRYYSAHDVIGLVKGVVTGELFTCLVLFTVTRLEGIPRSTPVIHALILGGGLVAGRALGRAAGRKVRLADRLSQPVGENVVLIGLSDLSVLYMKFLEAGAAGYQRVIAVLDAEPRWLGRTVNGVPVFGPPAQLESLLDEFAIHGVQTNRVVMGGTALSEDAVAQVRRVCAHRGLDFVSVPDFFRPGGASRESMLGRTASPTMPEPAAGRDIALPRYFRVKRRFDFAIALFLAMALLPLAIVVAAAALFDVGLPILFWQQRAGLNGRQFLMYKIRTLRPSREWQSGPEPVPSWIGQLLRKTRLDELPQVLNVLVGDMSLIGPRPLLPRDQPPTPSVRLMVRPGITGWAQVNGGQLLSPKEKEELDEWYIRNASLPFDLLILGLTLRSLIRGDRRSETALAEARVLRQAAPDHRTPPIERVGAIRA